MESQNNEFRAVIKSILPLWNTLANITIHTSHALMDFVGVCALRTMPIQKTFTLVLKLGFTAGAQMLKKVRAMEPWLTPPKKYFLPAW